MYPLQRAEVRGINGEIYRNLNLHKPNPTCSTKYDRDDNSNECVHLFCVLWYFKKDRKRSHLSKYIQCACLRAWKVFFCLPLLTCPWSLYCGFSFNVWLVVYCATMTAWRHFCKKHRPFPSLTFKCRGCWERTKIDNPVSLFDQLCNLTLVRFEGSHGSWGFYRVLITPTPLAHRGTVQPFTLFAWFIPGFRGGALPWELTSAFEPNSPLYSCPVWTGATVHHEERRSRPASWCAHSPAAVSSLLGHQMAVSILRGAAISFCKSCLLRFPCVARLWRKDATWYCLLHVLWGGEA